MTGAVTPCQLGSTARVHACGDVLLASQPARDDFELAKQMGVQTVISQRHAGETPEFDEASCVAQLGMAFENPAWNGADELTDAAIDAQRELLRSSARPILFHCAGANRVGAVWMAYRALDEGAELESARKEAKQVGLVSEDYERIVLDYIARHRKSS